MTGSASRAGLFGTAVGPLALPAEKLRTVLDCPRIFPLPGAPESLPGVLVFNGQPVPLFDWAGEGLAEISASAGYVVILSTDYGLVGVPVQLVGLVLEGFAEQPVAEDFAGLAGVVAGFRDGSDLYPLIDIDNLVANLPEMPCTGADRQPRRRA